jgi:hypothetical protein
MMPGSALAVAVQSWAGKLEYQIKQVPVSKKNFELTKGKKK